MGKGNLLQKEKMEIGAVIELCVDAEKVCPCMANECKRIYENDSDVMEQCYMDTCFISKRALPDDTLVQVFN